MKNKSIEIIVDAIYKSKNIVAFTGAGISAESGIPTFRADDGIWKKHNPQLLEISFYKENPAISWKFIKDIFYSTFVKTKPNNAHLALAWFERINKLRAIITQNIDNLHQEAGSKNVIEFHGNSKKLVCLSCNAIHKLDDDILQMQIPKCPVCGGLLKPDFVFFGENIDKKIHNLSMRESQLADLFIIIGASGEIYPAGLIPENAKFYGATIIEINTEQTRFSETITDEHLEMKATKAMDFIVERYKEKYF